jgi:hypothetical protein
VERVPPGRRHIWVLVYKNILLASVTNNNVPADGSFRSGPRYRIQMVNIRSRKGRLEAGPSAAGIPSREIRRSFAVLKPPPSMRSRIATQSLGRSARGSSFRGAWSYTSSGSRAADKAACHCCRGDREDDRRFRCAVLHPALRRGRWS